MNCCSEYKTFCNQEVTLGDLINILSPPPNEEGCVVTLDTTKIPDIDGVDKNLMAISQGVLRQLTNSTNGAFDAISPSNDVIGFKAPSNNDKLLLKQDDVEFYYTTFTGLTMSEVNLGPCDFSGNSKVTASFNRYRNYCDETGRTTTSTTSLTETTDLSVTYDGRFTGFTNVLNSGTITSSTSTTLTKHCKTITASTKLNVTTPSVSVTIDKDRIPCEGGPVKLTLTSSCDVNVYLTSPQSGSMNRTSSSTTINIGSNPESGERTIDIKGTISGLGGKIDGEVSFTLTQEACGGIDFGGDTSYGSICGTRLGGIEFDNFTVVNNNCCS